MRFSEYILNESLDEGIKDKLKDTAIKAGRKLGIQKAKDTETSGEKANRLERVAKEKAKQEKIKSLTAEIEKDSKEATEIFKKVASPIKIHSMPFNSDYAKRHAEALMGKDAPEKLVNFNISILTDEGKSISKPPMDKIKEVKDALYNKAFKELSKKWYVNNMWYHEPCILLSVAHKI